MNENYIPEEEEVLETSIPAEDTIPAEPETPTLTEELPVDGAMEALVLEELSPGNRKTYLKN